MRSTALSAALAAFAIAAAPAQVAAHGDDSAKYESIITAVEPQVPGLEVSVPGGGAHMEVRNRTGREVVVEGYEGERFARLRPDGTVEVNLRSPSWWINKDTMGNAPVPPEATADARPVWKSQTTNGLLDWHDHRIHWMGGALPERVKDPAKRTKVLDWEVPLTVGNTEVKVSGVLWWKGDSAAGATVPASAIAVLIAVGLLIAIIALLRLRGRGRSAR